MCANMNVINNVNAKTSNVLDNFNACKEYTSIETDAMITAATLQYFGLEGLAVPEEEFIPPSVINGSKPDRRIWLHTHVKAILEKYVMSKQGSDHADVRTGVAAASQPPHRGNFKCQVCGREFRYRKAMGNHIHKQHPNSTELSPPESSPYESPACQDEITDDRFSYACVRLSLGLLLRNMDDAVKEGDGERILRCWKISMLIFRAHRHPKYALASLYLQAATQAILPARAAHRLVWNRTVNNKGGPGKNISLDLRLEHINNLTKGLLKHLGPSITEEAARRCSKAVGGMEKLLNAVDSDLAVTKPHGHHSSRKSEHDFKTLVSEIHERAKMFTFNPSGDRQYHHFPRFQRSVLGVINHRLLNDWLTKHKKELAKFEGKL